MSERYDETAATCLRVLASRSATLATAESLTCGLVAASLAAAPGASTVLRGGLAAYATDVKIDVLGVDAGLIATQGVISASCVEQMAVRARGLLVADWAVSTTGVAGPDPQDGHPPGEVYVGVAGPHRRVASRALTLKGDREQIRQASAQAALTLLLEELTGPSADAVTP